MAEVTFLLEDGTGIAGATSYVSVDEMKQYFFNQDYEYEDYTTAEIQRLLNKSTSYVDNNYRNGFPGTRLTGAQSLEFPRLGAYYIDGYTIGEDEIPTELKNAVCEMSQLISLGNDPNAVISKDGKIIKESSQVDVIKESVSYEEGSSMYSDIFVPVDTALSRITGGVSDNYVLSIIRVGGESR